MIWLSKRLYGYNKVSTKLLYAQAWHETGDFKSEVFKVNRNLFGMRQPKKRKTFAIGSNLGHATFKNHWDSIRDYFERQKEFSIPDSVDNEYMQHTVNSNYAEDNQYIQKWRNINDNIILPTNNLFIYAGLFFLVLLASVFLFKRKSK